MALRNHEDNSDRHPMEDGSRQASFNGTRHLSTQSFSEISAMSVELQPPSHTEGFKHNAVVSERAAPEDQPLNPDILVENDEHHPRTTRISSNSNLPFYVRASNWWIWEVLAALLSISCLMGIVTICVHVKDKPLSHWASSISPNAMISTLSTLSKAGILVVLSGSISQQKWLYFARNRPQRLKNIDTFHEASQGPFGALKFLAKMRLSAIVASVASLIIIIALAFEPMAQQVLNYVNKLSVDPSLKSSLPVAQVYSKNAGAQWSRNSLFAGASGYTSSADESMQAAILDGLFSASGGGREQSLKLPVQCDAATCDWPEHYSLGLCSTCSDVTAQVSQSCMGDLNTGRDQVCEYVTPSGLKLTTSIHSPGHAVIRSLLNMTFADAMQVNVSSSDLVVSFGMIRIQDGQKPPSAVKDVTECTMTWCAQSFDAVTISNANTMSTSPAKEWKLKWDGPWDYILPGPPQPSIRNVVFSVADNPEGSISNRTFTINDRDIAGVAGVLMTLFGIDRTSSGTNSKTTEDSVGFDMSDTFLTTSNVSQIVANIGKAVSNNIRLNGNTTVGANSNAAPAVVGGTARNVDTFIVVSWGWLSLPIMVVAAGIILLVTTVIDDATASLSNTQPKSLLWKSSNLGLLYHGLDVSASLQTKGNNDFVSGASCSMVKQRVKDRARQTMVRLRRDDEGKMGLIPEAYTEKRTTTIA